jgi:hypothetical protein
LLFLHFVFFFCFVRLILLRFYERFLFLSSFCIFLLHYAVFTSFTSLLLPSFPSYSFVPLFYLLSFLSDHMSSDSVRYPGFFVLEMTLNPKKSVALHRESCRWIIHSIQEILFK